MKVAIVVGASLGMLPWSYFYLDEFLKYECEITVISWNREGVGNEGIDARVCIKEYKENIDNSVSKIKKIMPFLRFRKFANKILKEENFDLVVVSTLQVGLLIRDILKKKYQGRYIYDVRDPGVESKFLISKLSDRIVKDASLVYISSEAFRRWLPQDSKIVVTHNVRFQDKGEYDSKNRSCQENTIRICFWGITREIKTNIRFINLIANDSRFSLDYYGVLLEESKAIFNYCKENSIRNVHYRGTFPKDGRMSIAQNTDMIHDIYMSEKEDYDTRMFNKYYDGVVFEIPQIAFKGGFTGECVEKYGVGLSIALEEGDTERLYQYYINLNREEFHANCLKEQQRIREEVEYAQQRLGELIKNVIGK